MAPMQNSMMLFTFFFEWKYPNLVQKIKIISFSWNLVHTLIWTCTIQWWFSLFLFLTGNTFLAKFGPKNQNYQFKLKFGTCTNSSMLNSMVVFTFSVCEWKCLFWANFVQKVKIISLSWNLVPRLIRVCRIQWWYSLFLFLIGNTLVRQIWSKKSKLSVEAEIWYLDLFEYAEFSGSVHCFYFSIRNALFGQMWSKISKLWV